MEVKTKIHEYSLGGHTEGGVSTTKILVYSPRYGRWRHVGDMTVGRWRNAVSVLPNIWKYCRNVVPFESDDV